MKQTRQLVESFFFPSTSWSVRLEYHPGSSTLCYCVERISDVNNEEKGEIFTRNFHFGWFTLVRVRLK